MSMTEKGAGESISTVEQLRGSVQGIIWDLDGTLYELPDGMHQDFENRAYWAVTELRGWNRNLKRAEFDRVLGELGSTTKTLQHFGIDADRFCIDSWMAMDLRGIIHPDPELGLMLERLTWEKKIRQAIVSNGNSIETVEMKLELLEINPFAFEVIVTSIELGSHKPEPEPFSAAVNGFGLEPSQVVCVGDRKETDIDGAIKAGLKAIMVGKPCEAATLAVESRYDVGRIFGVDVQSGIPEDPLIL